MTTTLHNYGDSVIMSVKHIRNPVSDNCSWIQEQYSIHFDDENQKWDFIWKQGQVLKGYNMVFMEIFLKDFIYLFMRDTEREREVETQAKREAGSMQEAWCGTRSWDPRITPWAKGRHSTTEPPRCPYGASLEFHDNLDNLFFVIPTGIMEKQAR